MAGLGLTEIIVILLALLFMVGVPVALILILYFVMRKKRSNPLTKKCSNCGYSIPLDATVCQTCGRELPV